MALLGDNISNIFVLGVGQITRAYIINQTARKSLGKLVDYSHYTYTWFGAAEWISATQLGTHTWMDSNLLATLEEPTADSLKFGASIPDSLANFWLPLFKKGMNKKKEQSP